MEMTILVPDGYVLIGTRTENGKVIIVVEKEDYQPIGFRTEPVGVDEPDEEEPEESFEPDTQETLFTIKNDQS